ncbi:MAG: PUR family DNA/RNA-binding protein [Candidatus Phocaeicola faecigallinarum]|uniref:PUR family DNA/RNA-binding protein n=1 Tax=Candidatus Phocaeicola faecigallinarum TaxID=2838732 RepID=A0A948TBL7_9BACT|nr:PUR family DNA/RNA-binding protein [Candidatus Phocaeicola faecigallinarum]
MEDLKKKSMTETDKEIVFSKAIKAGKRIYYVDVRKNKKDDMFLAITESKKVISGEGVSPAVSFEKHKIFLYKEDFDKFLGGLQEAIKFIEDNKATDFSDDNNLNDNGEENNFKSSSDIKIDIDF